MKKIVIAIDGHSSCGKSTMAKALARRIGYVCVDTGALYRAVTLSALRHGMIDAEGRAHAQTLAASMDQVKVSFSLDADTRIPETCLNGENVEHDIRGMEVSAHVSAIAALPFVRRVMEAQQKAMGRDKGIVMDGRDVGTVLFPDAELKIFVTATAEVRARRRYNELKAKGMDADYDEILKNVQQRDYIDSHREVSPLRKADDALELDNSNITLQQQDEWLMQRYLERVK